MNRRQFLKAAPALAAAVGLPAAPDPTSRTLPNIVIIMADDYGWGSCNVNGAPKNLIRTPNIDRLAKEGVRFTDANTSSSVCSPTRYALMTGRYCWRTPLKAEVLQWDAPLHIETNRMTLASLTKSAGYNTAAVGKWHLGYGTGKADYTSELKPGPLEIGFDYHFAVPSNHGDVTGVYVENHKVAGLRSSQIKAVPEKNFNDRPYKGFDAPQRKDETVMDTLTDHAVKWISQQSASKPFFLYFTPVAIHNPITPSRRRGSSGAGTYGDWIHELDDSVGAVLKALDDKGFAKNTLLIFTSDNGGVLQTDGDTPQAVAYKAGLRVNGDFRAGKHSVYQGGFRVPYFVRWPGKAPAGAVSKEPINHVDMLATLAAVVGKPLPPPDQGAEDSHNILPTFLGKKLDKPIREHLITHSADGIFGYREGKWKYIEGVPAKEVPKPRKGEMVAQLYDLALDPAETKNVINEHRDIAARMADALSTAKAKGHTRRN